jgi:hypothetical protein
VTDKEEDHGEFSIFGGPRPGEILAAKDAEDTSVEGAAFLDLVASEEDKRAAALRDLLDRNNDEALKVGGDRSGSYRALMNELGTVLSLMDRLGSCWWGCTKGDHTVQYAVAASVGNALCALRLLRAGYYDEPLGLARQIAERANLLELFLVDEGSLQEWSGADSDTRRKKFKGVLIRKKLESLDIQPITPEEHYRYLSGFGIHPDRVPQYFGENFPPTIGGVLKWRGLTIALQELAYPVAMVGATGAAILSDDERIPAERIIQGNWIG